MTVTCEYWYVFSGVSITVVPLYLASSVDVPATNSPPALALGVIALLNQPPAETALEPATSACVPDVVSTTPTGPLL